MGVFYGALTDLSVCDHYCFFFVSSFQKLEMNNEVLQKTMQMLKSENDEKKNKSK